MPTNLAKTVRVDAPNPPAVRGMVLTLQDTPNPAGGAVALMETSPTKPLRLARVMVESSDEPDGIVREDWAVDMRKSSTLIDIVI